MDRCRNWIVVRAQPASLLCRRRRGAAFRPRRRAAAHDAAAAQPADPDSGTGPGRAAPGADEPHRPPHLGRPHVPAGGAAHPAPGRERGRVHAADRGRRPGIRCHRLYRDRLPGVDLVLEEMVTAEQVEALASRRIDVALLRPPVRRELDSLRVVREPLLAALPADHRLAKGRRPTLGDFDRLPFVMYSPYEARYFYDLLAAIFAKAGVAPRYVQHMSQIHAILALVRAGLGAALVPAAAASLRFQGVALRPVETRPARPVELFLAWVRNNDNPALPAFLDMARLTAERAARSSVKN